MVDGVLQFHSISVATYMTAANMFVAQSAALFGALTYPRIRLFLLYYNSTTAV